MDLGFGLRIAEERKRLGLHQDTIASICGVSRNSWGKYERGLAGMPIEVLRAFAEQGADILYIVTGNLQTGTAATSCETLVLRNFRVLPEQTQKSLLDLLDTLAKQQEN